MKVNQASVEVIKPQTKATSMNDCGTYIYYRGDNLSYEMFMKGFQQITDLYGWKYRNSKTALFEEWGYNYRLVIECHDKKTLKAILSSLKLWAKHHHIKYNEVEAIK